MLAAAEEKLMQLYQSSQFGVAGGEAYNILGSLQPPDVFGIPLSPGLTSQTRTMRRLADYILAGLVFGATRSSLEWTI